MVEVFVNLAPDPPLLSIFIQLIEILIIRWYRISVEVFRPRRSGLYTILRIPSCAGNSSCHRSKIRKLWNTRNVARSAA